MELRHTYKFVAAESGTVVDRSHALPRTMYTTSTVRPNWKIVEPCFFSRESDKHLRHLLVMLAALILLLAILVLRGLHRVAQFCNQLLEA